MLTTHRLRSSADIRRAVAMRQAAGTAHVVVHAHRRDDDGDPRVAIVAGRRVGNAVARNRAKRRLRAVIRTLTLADGVDFVVTAKAGSDVVDYATLSSDVRGCIRRALKRLPRATMSPT